MTATDRVLAHIDEALATPVLERAFPLAQCDETIGERWMRGEHLFLDPSLQGFVRTAPGEIRGMRAEVLIVDDLPPAAALSAAITRYREWFEQLAAAMNATTATLAQAVERIAAAFADLAKEAEPAKAHHTPLPPERRRPTAGRQTPRPGASQPGRQWHPRARGRRV